MALFSHICKAILILVLIGGSYTLAQDLQGGAASSNDLKGGARPANPPVRRRAQFNKTVPNTKPEPSEANLTSKSSVSQKTRFINNEVEDALALGNSARDSKPPKYEDAERAYKLAAKLDPDDPRPYIGLGNIYYDQKKYDESAKSYKRALILMNPGIVAMVGGLQGGTLPAISYPSYQLSEHEQIQLVIYLSRSYLQKEEWQKAELQLRRAIKGDKDNAELHALLGYSLFSQKKYDEATSSYEQAVKLDPNNREYKLLLEESRNKQKK